MARAFAASVIGACLLALSSAGVGQADGKQPFAGNLLIVTVDGLRADRLGVAGYLPAQHSLTPSLDALAKRGAYFKRVWAQAPSSARSLGSLLTSRYPADIAWGAPASAQPRLRTTNVSLLEALQAAGYRTIGVVPPRMLRPELGFGQGCDEWPGASGAGVESAAETDAAQVVPRAIARMKDAAGRKERFALWMHLSEPAERAVRRGAGSATQAQAAAAYDAVITATDRSIGKLIAALGELQLSGNTAVVVIGTHGAALGEHGAREQGAALFEEQVRVPLIVAVPNIAAMKVDIPTAAIDLAPTLLDLVGRSRPAEFQGESLLAHVRNLAGPADKVRPVHAELMAGAGVSERAVMLVVDGFKLIHRPARGRFELYSLREDRAEQHDLVADPNYKVALATLRKRLAAFERRGRQKPDTKPATD